MDGDQAVARQGVQEAGQAVLAAVDLPGLRQHDAALAAAHGGELDAEFLGLQFEHEAPGFVAPDDGLLDHPAHLVGAGTGAHAGIPRATG